MMITNSSESKKEPVFAIHLRFERLCKWNRMRVGVCQPKVYGVDFSIGFDIKRLDFTLIRKKQYTRVGFVYGINLSDSQQVSVQG